MFTISGTPGSFLPHVVCSNTLHPCTSTHMNRDKRSFIHSFNQLVTNQYSVRTDASPILHKTSYELVEHLIRHFQLQPIPDIKQSHDFEELEYYLWKHFFKTLSYISEASASEI